MPPPISVSKTKLLSFIQCPRKLWLEQYSPELEDEGAVDYAAMETGRVVGEQARIVYGNGGGHRIAGERGLRAAVADTARLIESGGKEPIFEASFDYDGLTVQVDILDRSDSKPRIVEVKSATELKPHYLNDCAIQAWTLEKAGYPVAKVSVALIDNSFVYRGDGDYSGLFVESDVSAEVARLQPEIPAIVAGARATLDALDEPEDAIGEHCRVPHVCPFFEHCAPAQGEFPVSALGGRKQALYELMLAGASDVREVPESKLANEQQRRIWEQTRAQAPFVAPELKPFATDLPRPRYYLDFETIAFAIPIWPDTRPYEALPFQWSCHIDGEGSELEHREFLDLSGNPPMRVCAECLLEACGSEGPIVVYTAYEKRVINALAERYPDLADDLRALIERIVDLFPVTKAHYYHPAMKGSWSIKSVLPTIGSELDYASLTEVRDGEAAQAAYLEAIAPGTSEDRRQELQRALVRYCELDTLALTELVEFFAGT